MFGWKCSIEHAQSINGKDFNAGTLDLQVVECKSGGNLIQIILFFKTISEFVFWMVKQGSDIHQVAHDLAGIFAIIQQGGSHFAGDPFIQQQLVHPTRYKHLQFLFTFSLLAELTQVFEWIVRVVTAMNFPDGFKNTPPDQVLFFLDIGIVE